MVPFDLSSEIVGEGKGRRHDRSIATGVPDRAAAQRYWKIA
jgi:hypothetical protein